MASKTAERQLTTLPLDAVAEDLFGLNLRGLRSVRAAWTEPRRYYDAARSLDWSGRFTPSIRLWLSFFALYSALKFWWIGGNGGMIEAYAAGFAKAGVIVPTGRTIQDIGREAVLWVFGVIPILQIVTMMFVSMVFPFWGEPTTLALRQRYFFVTLIPSTSLMPVFLSVMVFVPSDALTAYGVALALVAFAVDFQMGLRGGFANLRPVSRAWRAGLLAFIVVGLNVLTSIAAQIVGIVMTSSKYGVAPPT